MVIISVEGKVVTQFPPCDQLINERFGASRESCLLYTSDAADEGLGVDLGGRRIIKKKIKEGSVEVVGVFVF